MFEISGIFLYLIGNATESNKKCRNVVRTFLFCKVRFLMIRHTAGHTDFLCVLNFYIFLM